MGLNEKVKRIYATVAAVDGSIRIAVDKPDDIDDDVKSYIDENGKKVVRRDYELSDGTTGCKWEHVYKSITGMVKYVGLYDGDYGSQVSLTIADEGEEGIIMSLNCKQTFGQDVMKKLPNVDFTKEVDLRPYSFDDKETGKNKRGITIWQEGERVLNYFYDVDKKEVLHSFPVPEKAYDKMDSDDWVVFFVGVTKFLKAYTRENILPQFQTSDEEVKAYASPEETVKGAGAKKKPAAKKAAVKKEETKEEEPVKKATKPPF